MDDSYQTATIESSLYIHNNSTHEKSSSAPIKNKEFLNDVLEGLNQTQKTLPCKYFYDEKGSQLFEKICQLDEYYLTRTELKLLEEIKQELSHEIGKDAVIIEPGAGAGKKIQILFGALESPQTYVPMDISKDFLFYSANVIQDKFPNIQVSPIQGDFTHPIKWMDKESENRIIFFPGSTIGNLEPKSAIEFLENMKDLMGDKGAMIIGVDRIKNRQDLINAYDDSLGVTEAFNKNLLARINHELNGQFKLEHFEHRALFNEIDSRIEMHLVSKKQQNVIINGHRIEFQNGETIHTENSHKYSDESFLELVTQAGMKTVKSWTDDKKLFNIYYLKNQ